ncbi:MAG: hypothetical protein VZQ75_10430, partial [Candidatus Faecousia sp.]|nr:hypothetical protein [Candidatus Faecousia sp.]
RSKGKRPLIEAFPGATDTDLTKSETEKENRKKTVNPIVSILNPIGRCIIMKLPKFKNPLKKEEM